MGKKGKVAVIIVILVVLLLAAIGTAVYFYLDNKNKNNVIQELNSDIESLNEESSEADEVKNNLVAEENKEQEEKYNADEENKELVEKCLKIKGSGDSIGYYLKIMEIEDKNEKMSYYNNRNMIESPSGNNYRYYLTDDLYSDYEKKVGEIFATDSLDGINKVMSNFAGGNIIEVDGKVAISELGWSGRDYRFESQELVSSENGKYVYRITYSRNLTMEENSARENLTGISVGKIENGNYRLESFE